MRYTRLKRTVQAPSVQQGRARKRHGHRLVVEGSEWSKTVAGLLKPKIYSKLKLKL